MSPLNALGLAIGWFDIFGALLFELMILYMMKRCFNSRPIKDVEKQQQSDDLQQPQRRMTPKLYGPKYLHDNSNAYIFWGYLLLLNAWIVITLVMMAGIVLHKPQLMLMWLIWCIGGLVFDMFFLFWWLYELLAGDSIEAITNIMISLLTMAIEFGFIYVIHRIYENLSQSTEVAADAKVTTPVYSFMII
ncbi:uncharacterized protein Dwil_GK27243 [Drosophila willistoni]|uniref:Uncharacterized protein n=1 Tax=Drosophila willistoni TaxID=7260 RepID=A0A0Q9WSH6_DROWI|nr:uncharacterized protein LOC26529245 [Drosophila willistoni]KRF99214.1 uncharacterized protein Dwil_GK27243 [Drosophila willistoni]